MITAQFYEIYDFHLQLTKGGEMEKKMLGLEFRGKVLFLS